MAEKISQVIWKRESVINSIKTSSQKINSRLSGLNIPPFFKNIKFIITAAAVLVIAVLLLSDVFSPAQSSVPTYTVKKDNFLVSITESGELRAKNSISIASPRIRGTLKIVYLVPEGTYVKSGDEVIKFDPSEALNSLKEAESNLEIALSERQKLLANHSSAQAQAESDFKNAELSYELSKLNLEQIKFEAEIKQQEAKLQHKKNELAYDKAKQDNNSREIIRKAELNKMEIEVQQKRADLEKAKRDLEMLTLSAPADGLVVYEVNWNNNGRKFNVGDQISWGGMPIISLPDLSVMESITYVNEVDVSKVKKGQEVKIKLDAFQDSTFAAVIDNVARLGRNKENNSNIKVFEINVLLKSKSDILKPGMTTSNQIIINQIPNVLYVPQESVFEKDNKKIVYVKNGSGFDEQVVEVGEKSENYVVISKGIKAGDEVALRDPNIILEEDESPSGGTAVPVNAAGK